jgi:galactose mutarotase-like enzyme
MRAMAITLRSGELEALITPERGADVRQLTDLATGTPVFTVSPTGAANVPRLPSNPTIAAGLNGYPGGWQLMVPNAGPEREHRGVLLGFHGESCLAEWTVLQHRSDGCRLEAYLLTAPLRLVRDVTLEGPELRITDTVTNLSPDPYSTRLLLHPAFGSPFLDQRSYLVSRAATLITDADAPGTLTGPGEIARPDELLPAGPVAGSLALPGPGSRDALFATLTDFEDGEATFYSPTRGFGMRLRWDPSVFPHAWFWVEANATADWPWFRRMFAIAVEPSNVVAGAPGTTGRFQRAGDGTEIAGEASLSFTTTLTRVPLP